MRFYYSITVKQYVLRFLCFFPLQDSLWSFRWLLRRFRFFAVFGLRTNEDQFLVKRLPESSLDKRSLSKESYSAFFGNPLIYHSSKERSTNGFKSYCKKRSKKVFLLPQSWKMSSESILTCTRPFFNVFCQTRKEMEGENQVTTNFGTKILTCHSSVLLKRGHKKL